MILRGLFLTALLLSSTVAAPISLHPKNPHYFLFRASTVALVTSGEHYGAVLNANFNYRRGKPKEPIAVPSFRRKKVLSSPSFQNGIGLRLSKKGA